MITVESLRELIDVYIVEAYRRVYSNSIDEFGNIGDYDILYNRKIKDKHGRIIIPYDDYYCPNSIQKEIIESLVDEPYKIRNYKTKHYLTMYEKQALKNNFYLGCSPCSKFKSFKRMHPDIKFDLDIDEED